MISMSGLFVSGFTKYPCFLCMWDSRDTAQHYTKKMRNINENQLIMSQKCNQFSQKIGFFKIKLA